MTAADLTIPALAIAAGWMSVLTVFVLVALRQVAILNVRIELAGSRFSVANDGPEIGTAVPVEVAEIVPHSNLLSYVLVTSAICAPCREIVPGLADHRPFGSVIALLSGPAEAARGLAQLFPDWVTVIEDPEATRLARSLSVQSTPFAVQIRSGRVAGKAYLHTAADLSRLDAAARTGGKKRPPLALEARRVV